MQANTFLGRELGKKKRIQVRFFGQNQKQLECSFIYINKTGEQSLVYNLFRRNGRLLCFWGFFKAFKTLWEKLVIPK